MKACLSKLRDITDDNLIKHFSMFYIKTNDYVNIILLGSINFDKVDVGNSLIVNNFPDWNDRFETKKLMIIVKTLQFT